MWLYTYASVQATCGRGGGRSAGSSVVGRTRGRVCWSWWLSWWSWSGCRVVRSWACYPWACIMGCHGCDRGCVVEEGERWMEGRAALTHARRSAPWTKPQAQPQAPQQERASERTRASTSVNKAPQSLHLRIPRPRGCIFILLYDYNIKERRPPSCICSHKSCICSHKKLYLLPY